MARNDDDIFKPKIGRIRNLGGARAKTYVNRVLSQISAAGKRGFGSSTGSRGFSGARIGRGNDAVRHRRAGHRFGPSYRRVVIKTRITKFNSGGPKSGIGAARAHLRYIQRDGVAKENVPGQLYDATHEEADGKAFLERSEGDRHQFRFIVSPEDTAEMADLKPFVRDLMQAVEKDLETRLDWVAVDHFNTEHPHTHIVLRGTDELGKDLIIARDYIAHGMRQRASEILTLELGPQTTREITEKYWRQVDQDRFTNLDRELVRDVEGGVIETAVKPATPADRFKHAMRMGRLRHLERQGLAREIQGGEWELSPNLETTLRRAGERGDIIKTMHRGLKQAGLDAGASEFAIYDPLDARAGIVTGRIIDRGLHDELNDGHYILVDAADGRVHHIALDPKQDMDDLPKGAIVEVHPASNKMKPSDRVIGDIASGNGGIYSPDAHAAHDPSASPEFIQAHIRRLEALRRMNIVRRFADGSWEIPNDFSERAAERQKATSRYPGQINTLSSFSLERQVKAEGATWLDRQLVSSDHLPVRGSQFGKAVTAALQRRQDHLIEQGWAGDRGGTIRYRRYLLNMLRQRELQTAGEKIAKESKSTFVQTSNGEHFEGVYRKSVHLASGKFAIIEKSKEFTLVPWRAVLERQRGKTVAGAIRGATVSFDLSKKRGLGLS
jgi:type IV secretory pathway VirD2 relaxase